MRQEPLPPQIIDDVPMVILKPEENDGTLLRDSIATAPAGGAGSADFVVPTGISGSYTPFRVLEE
jgi:hypothetical protein